MSSRSTMLPVLVALFVLLAWTCTGNAQTSFRPGRDGGEFSGYEDVRGALDTIGLLRAEPEPWYPLPQARAIMDQLVANGDLQDDSLKNSWEEIQRIAAEIEAAWPNCEVEGVAEINRQLELLRVLGNELRERRGEIANIRIGVTELYDPDAALFAEKVGNLPNVQQSGAESLSRSLANRTMRAVSDAIGGPGTALRAGLLRVLGVVSVTIGVGEQAVASYEGFVAYQRLPHILEKYEMIAYLMAMDEQYSAVIEAINGIRRRTAEIVTAACPCLPSRMVPDGQAIDAVPFTAEHRVNELNERIEELRGRAARGHEVGVTLGRYEAERNELMQVITSRSERERASRAWHELLEDNATSRRRYGEFQARQRNR
jgi:polyhydroxyalkanoate synthesis regulator phasin